MDEQARDISPDTVLARLSAVNARAREREEHARRLRRVGRVGGGLAVLALIVGGVVWGVHAPRGARPTLVTTAAQKAVPAASTTASSSGLDAVTTIAVPPAPQTVQLTLTATGAATWLEVRDGSSTGEVLYSGTLEPGASQEFTSTRLWARLGGAANVDVTLNGKPVPMPAGTYDAVFDSSGFHRPGG